MSDLDDLFRQKLEEESAFPNREKNWRLLSRRLDAFDSGGARYDTLSKRGYILRYAAAAAVVGLLIWNIVLQRQNAALLERVSHSENHIPASKFPAAPIENPSAVAGSQQLPSQDPFQTNATRQAYKERTTNKQNSAGNMPGFHSRSAAANPHSPDNGFVEKAPEKPERDPARATPGPETAFSLLKLENDVFEKGDPLETALALVEDKGLEERNPAGLPEVDESVRLSFVEPCVRNNDTAYAPIVVNDLAAMPTKIHKTGGIKLRGAVGVEGVFGLRLPGLSGVSPIAGQGLTGELRLFKGLALSVSHQWLGYDVDAADLPRGCNLPPQPNPDPPGPGGNKFKLIRVESKQRLQQTTAGLSWYFPLPRGWEWTAGMRYARASVQPAIANFHFEKDHHHGQDTLIIGGKAPRSFKTNSWQPGMGLQWNRSRMSFAFHVDYAPSTSGPRFFDALYLRAGAKVNI